MKIKVADCLREDIRAEFRSRLRCQGWPLPGQPMTPEQERRRPEVERDLDERTEEEAQELARFVVTICREMGLCEKVRRLTIRDKSRCEDRPSGEAHVRPVRLADGSIDLGEWGLWMYEQARDDQWLIRHELTHIADTLDPEFRWDQQDSETRCAEWFALFSKVWNININARLAAKGYTPGPDSKEDSISDLELGREVGERMAVAEVVPYQEIAEATGRLWPEWCRRYLQ